jgi:RNA polymerase sigma-70 factor (ECF subfamily)
MPARITRLRNVSLLQAVGSQLTRQRYRGRCLVARPARILPGRMTTPNRRNPPAPVVWQQRPVVSACVRTSRGRVPLFGDNYRVDSPARGAAAQPQRSVEPSIAADDERELVSSVLRKDRKAAARFVAAHVDAVYAYARHRLAPRADLVDDVVQDVFLAALNGLSAFQSQSSLRAWLIGIARHKIEDVYRQRLRLPEAFADDMASAEGQSVSAPASLDEAIDTARVRAKARHVLAQMPERYGLMLLWRYWEQRSTRDMAVAIGTTEKSVERTLARARARFKELWLKE